MPLSKSRRTAGLQPWILADTSAWVEYDRATGSAVAERMEALVADDGPLAVCEPVIMEVCAGARDAQREHELRRLLLRFRLLRLQPASDFDAAVSIYRSCRSRGITPRGLLDCLIAAIAWRNDAALLACDRDLIAIAEVMSVPLDVASTTA
jgi:predicted nucleic acid-binding protein